MNACNSFAFFWSQRGNQFDLLHSREAAPTASVMSRLLPLTEGTRGPGGRDGGVKEGTMQSKCLLFVILILRHWLLVYDNSCHAFIWLRTSP